MRGGYELVAYRNKGISILETVLVIALLAIVMYLGLFQGRTALSHRKVEGVARTLKGALVYTRSLAVGKGGALLRFNGAFPDISALEVVDKGGKLYKTYAIPPGIEITPGNSLLSNFIRFGANGGLTSDTVGSASWVEITVREEGGFAKRLKVYKTTGMTELY